MSPLFRLIRFAIRSLRPQPSPHVSITVILVCFLVAVCARTTVEAKAKRQVTMLVLNTLLLLLYSSLLHPISCISAKHLSIKASLPFASMDHYHVSSGNFSPFDHCETSLTPPKEKGIPEYTINLDLPPEQRWTKLVQDKRDGIVSLIENLKKNSDSYFGRSLFWMVDKFLPLLGNTLPKEYNQEMKGIAEATGITRGEVLLFNVFYEFFSVCTSIVAQSEDGTMYHGRNLDFGLFLGWDPINHTWQTTEFLKPLVVKLKFIKSNQTVFSSINYAGYIGILTAMKEGKFTLSIDERFRVNGGYVGLAEWILGWREQQWIGFLTRQVMETCDSYSCAQKMLAKPSLIAPVYFILSGSGTNEGCVITRGRNNYSIWPIGKKQNNQTGAWFLVQTNYDQWETPPLYDDRRTPAINCMDQLGRSDVPQTLWNVLSTRPVLNKLTTFTALMSASKNMLYVSLQTCPDPCWPW